MVQQRCQWSGEKARVISALKFRDATNAYQSAEEAAHGLVLHETDKQLLDKRISRAIVNIADEETEIDLPAGSRIWPGEFCAPRVLVKATCNAFTPSLERLEVLGKCHALRVEQCLIP